MISASEIQTRVLARLDAEGSDRYTFDNDIKPAINGAMEDIVTMLNAAFAEDKIKPESLRELIKTRVWEPSVYSRIAIETTELERDLWSILAVFPNCQVNDKSATCSNSTEKSKLRKDISFIGGTNAAKRSSIESWIEIEENVFLAGNPVLTGTLKEYAYLDQSDYSTTTNVTGPEISIKPSVEKKFVAISILMYPLQVTSTSSNIEFPKSLTEFFVELTANKIAYKQGEAPLIQITEAHINKLSSYFR